MQNGSIEYPMNGTSALAPCKTANKIGVAKIIQFPGMQDTKTDCVARVLKNDDAISSLQIPNSASSTLKNKLIEWVSYSEMLTSLRYDGLSGVHFTNVSKQDKVLGIAIGLISMTSILILGM